MLGSSAFHSSHSQRNFRRFWWFVGDLLIETGVWRVHCILQSLQKGGRSKKEACQLTFAYWFSSSAPSYCLYVKVHPCTSCICETGSAELYHHCAMMLQPATELQPLEGQGLQAGLPLALRKQHGFCYFWNFWNILVEHNRIWCDIMVESDWIFLCRRPQKRWLTIIVNFNPAVWSIRDSQMLVSLLLASCQCQCKADFQINQVHSSF